MIVSLLPMPDEEKTNLRLEIAHVLFMDIVGYSKLLVDEQREALHELNHIVRDTDAVRAAEAANSLVRLPTGDGMALVFTGSLEEPVECALQISQALRAQPSIPLRMGIHSGPVQHVEDVNGRVNIAGSGINIAQRVMDCGDAGHLLVSKRVADDLAGSRRWQPYLHELGDAVVKHGLVVSLVNLYAEAVGNPTPPAKFGGTRTKHRPAIPDGVARGSAAPHRRWVWVLVALLPAVLVTTFVLLRPLPHPAAPIQQPDAVPKAQGAAITPNPLDKSVAVLPFDNLSVEQENAYFAEGMQDEVLTDLSKLADLKVISRASVVQYKEPDKRNLREISQALGVAYVVEGSVQRVEHKIRVSASLIDARTDAQKWAEHYDRDLSDVFAIQSEIAQAIAKQLQAVISPAEHALIEDVPTHNEEAYQLYLRALALVEQRNISQAKPLTESIDLLQRATKLDPNFVRALVLLVRAHGVLYFNTGGTPADADAVRETAEAVARLRPDSTEAHLAMGYYHFYVQRDYPSARADFLQVVQQTPNDARANAILGSIERRQGHWEDALTYLRRARQLDPENGFSFNLYVELLQAMGRFSEAAAVYDRQIASHPEDLALHISKADLLVFWKADPRAARAELDALPPEFDPNGAVTASRINCDLSERDFAAAARTLAACPFQVIAGQPRSLVQGFIARYQGDAAATAASFNALRSQLLARVQKNSANPPLINMLAQVEAALGHKEEALATFRRLDALIAPDDVVQSTQATVSRALILALLDEREDAIRALQSVCGRPYGPNYGNLRLSPVWDPLRKDARFEAMVASLQPKP